jgi:pimeloyl-ACP methyl ester carboxylesterase
MSEAPRTLRHCAADARELIVLLPGAYMTPEDFIAAGFFAAVEQRRLPLDVTIPDFGLAAISSGAALPALQQHILTPARNHGYRRIRLGGISLGGLLSLCHVADTPACVDGLCLLAPYPGSRPTLNAIDQAGGLDAWTPRAEQLADPEFRMWRWLQTPLPDFPVFVGYGSEDRFAAGMRRIAERFPATDRLTLAGGHDWPVGRALGEDVLDHTEFGC